MKLMTVTAAFAAMVSFGQSAQARAHHHLDVVHYSESKHSYGAQRLARYDRSQHRDAALRHTERRAAGSSDYALAPSNESGGYGPRPSAWCGWEMRHLVGGDPGSSFNLARNWAHWGHSGPAGVGAVVVWSHHVGKIVGRENGEWVIESGNDGHALRTRPRSIGGAIAIRWGQG